MKFKNLILLSLAIFLLTSCAKNISQNAPIARDFDILKFCGGWYEIARIKGFGEASINTTYEFFVDKNGTINMLKSEESSTGKSKSNYDELRFSSDKNLGFLERVGLIKNEKFNIVQTDADYNYALVFGSDTSELYMLSRKKTMPELIRNIYLKKAEEYGYDSNKIVWTKQK